MFRVLKQNETRSVDFPGSRTIFKMKLILVRHGLTTANAHGILQGQAEFLLNQEGKEQVVKVAKRLKDEKINYIYSSDLQRCKETTAAICIFHPDAKVIFAKELRERSFGIYQEKPRVIMRKAVDKSGLDFINFKPEGGESVVQFNERINTFIQTVIGKHKDDTVLLVTHGGLIMHFLLTLFKEDFSERTKYHPRNTAVTIVELESFDNHKIHVLNCVLHLES